MKVVVLIITLFFSIHVMSEESENYMQMVCLGESSKNIYVITQREPNIEDGKELFNFVPPGSETDEQLESKFKIENVKLALEIFPASKEVLNIFRSKDEVFGESDKEVLKTNIKKLKITDRLVRFNGFGERKERFFKYQEEDKKGNQFRLNFTEGGRAAYTYSKYKDGLQCMKAYETSYKPLEESEPRKSRDIQTVDLDESCIVGVDPECVPVGSFEEPAKL